MLRRAFLLLLILVGFAGSVQALDLKDPDKFTADFAQQLTTIHPNYEILGTARLVIYYDDRRLGRGTISLDRIWADCQNNPMNCHNLIMQRIDRATAEHGPATAPLLRVVLRPAQTLAFMLKAAGPGIEPDAYVTAPFAGDLVMAVVVDHPNSTSYLRKEDLNDLKMTREDVIATAKRNTAAGLERIQTALHPFMDTPFGVTQGDDYECSRPLFDDGIPQLSAAWGGQLLMAVPSSRVVLYGDGRIPGMADKMREGIAHVMKVEERPISATLFHWTDKGWEPVPEQKS